MLEYDPPYEVHILKPKKMLGFNVLEIDHRVWHYGE
jgi:hypothetical protein